MLNMIPHKLISANKVLAFATNSGLDLTCVNLTICAQNNRLSSDISGYDSHPGFKGLDNFEVIYFLGTELY